MSNQPLLTRLLEMIRFSHTLFALPFALLSVSMAWTTPLAGGAKTEVRLLDLVGVLICMVGARSAAMAFNRLVDRRYDALNPRTATRHLPAGTLSVRSVILFTLASVAIFFLGTVCFLPRNWLPIALGTPVLLWLLGYSYAKRFTMLAHYWLGLALALAPVCAWIALRGDEVLRQPLDLLPALLLGAAVWTWVAGFDIIYACQDATFDARTGLHSIPARLGISGALRLAAASHLLTVLLFASIPFACPQVPLGVIYLTGVALVALLLVYEHALVKPNDLDRVNIAFFQVNIVISIGLFVMGTIDCVW